MSDTSFISSLTTFAKAKLRMAEREKQLVTALNSVLPRLGYRVVPASIDGSTNNQSDSDRVRTQSFSCPHCDRRFGHPLHLGRHVSAMHKKQPRRRTQVRAKKPKGVRIGGRSKRTKAA